MSVFKRGGTYYYEFVFNGERVRRSTQQGNERVAVNMEAAYRTALAKGTVDLLEREPIPRFQEFSKRFMDYIQTRCKAKPATVQFYAKNVERMLENETIAKARLDRIDEALIERFVQQRRKQVAPATVNRTLATLRRALRMAQEWRVIDRVPRIRLLQGEHNREFVLSHELEPTYLNTCPQPLKDVALLILDTGLRVGEALGLEWSDIHIEPASGAKSGYLAIRQGKSKHARRNLSLTDRVKIMLETRKAGATSAWVFTSEDGTRPASIFTLDTQHSRIRAGLNDGKNSLELPDDFVIHSLRHTFLTRMGEAGADAFTIMRLAGHSTVVVSQRYVHPSPEALERAFERLENLNQDKALQSQATGSKRGVGREKVPPKVPPGKKGVERVAS
jgi:integrase